MHRNFIEKVNHICNQNTDKEFIRYFKDNGTVEKWTYETFRAEVGQMITHIEKSSICKGDRVLLLSPISPEACRMIIALAIYGATCVLLDGEQPKEELDYLIEKSDIRAIITNSAYYNRDVKDYENEYPVFSLETGCQFCEREYSLSPTTDPDEEVMAILYSSGTTSDPKGVMISYEGQLCSAEILLRAFGTTDIRYLVVFPLFHISGFSTFLAIFLGGGQIGLLENANSKKLLEGFQKYHPNGFGMVPKIYETFQQKITEEIKNTQSGRIILSLISLCGLFRKYLHVNLGKHVFRSINRRVFGGEMIYLGVGGGLATKEVSHFFLNLGYRWMNTYAATEQNLPIVTTTISDNYPGNAVGKLSRFPEISIRIGNQNKKGQGEIQVKSPCQMKGYFRDAVATEQAYEGEYFKTGDLGYINSRGYLHVTGRSKESIHLPNGEKVSPEQIERLYASCIPKDVVSACVGVTAKEKDYDDIVFFIEKNNELDENRIRHEILEHSAKVGGNFRVSSVLFTNKIPLSKIGKVQRYKLRKQYDENSIMETKAGESKYSGKENLSTYEKLKQIFLKLGIETDITHDLVLEYDLGLDSLNLFGLCVEIESAFHVDVSKYISPQITVSELCQMIDADKSSLEVITEYDINDFPLKRRKIDRWIISFIEKLTRLCYSLKTSGLENIPPNGPYIICANHESHLDGMWILIASDGKIDLEQFCCLAKQEHLKHRLFRGGLRIMGGIPVDRNGNTSPAMKRVTECVQDGKIVLIHPEGTRTNNGELGNLKAGAERLALENQIPVLPVRIEGAYEIFPKHRKLPCVLNKDGRYKLSVQFLPLLQPYKGMTKQLSYMLGKDNPPPRNKRDLINLSRIIQWSQKIRKYYITGINNFESDKNYILCANHTSYFDPVWILTALGKKIDIGNIVTLAAIERSQDSKRFFRMLGGISVNRDQGVHPEIEHIKNCLKRGMNAIIFPEGARTRDGSLMELKKGAVKIAKDTHVAILPIHIKGGFEIFPRHKKIPRLFNWKKCRRFELEIDICSPIFPDDRSETEILKQLRHTLGGD